MFNIEYQVANGKKIMNLVWLLFIGLIVYIILNWKYKIDNQKLIHIRKVWFGIYLLGALIYWTSHPSSFFSEWKNYLIVATIFLLVDAFIFFGLYLKKAGNNELDRLPETITEIGDKADDYRKKVEKVHEILLGDAIIGYYTTEDEYFEELKKVIKLYADSEELNLTFLYYSSSSEKEIVAKRYEKYDFLEIEAHITSRETYYGKESKLALFPVYFNDKLLIIEIRSVKSITEIDIWLIDILLNMYVLGTELKEEDEQNG